jgi:hypothetical protein
MGGELSSKLNFSGNLQKISIRGETDAHDFVVKESGHRFVLKTQFDGSVDLVNGDVVLPSLKGKVGETEFIAAAKVPDRPHDSRTERHARSGPDPGSDFAFLGMRRVHP